MMVGAAATLLAQWGLGAAAAVSLLVGAGVAALLRHLAQRITARSHLLPLSHQDVDANVRFRLQIAGCVQPIFTPKALQTLHRLSGGVVAADGWGAPAASDPSEEPRGAP
jgi:hypothetical protein